MGGDDVTDPVDDPGEKSAKARRKREPKELARADRDYGQSASGDKKCGARKPGGGTCGLAAGFGTDHNGYGPCKYHLGQTPVGKKAAATEMADELMWFYGKPVDTNPIEVLLDEVNRTAGHVAWLAGRIAKFSVPLTILDEDSGREKPAGVPPEVEGWLRVYQSERAHLVRTSKAALDAGVNQRLVDIAESQGAKLADAVEVILAGLALTAAQQARVPQIVPNVLRRLTTGQPLLLEGVLADEPQ